MWDYDSEWVYDRPASLIGIQAKIPRICFLSLCETAWMWTPVFSALSPKPPIETKVQ